MPSYNEYGRIRSVAVRRPQDSFRDFVKIAAEWEALRFHAAPDIDSAVYEHRDFVDIMRNNGATIVTLPGDDRLTLDSIYCRDATLVSPQGLIVLNMGRASRNNEPAINVAHYKELGYPVHGTITAPGTVEGGDFIWLDDKTAAVGLGTRTNEEGIRQLVELLGPDVELKVVKLPPPDHPDDVFHLMSMISPVDKDLAVVYTPLMPKDFLDWLSDKGIQFIDVPEDEFLPMACNVLALGPRDVLMLDQLPKTKALLEAAGAKVTAYKGTEISRKGEGGPTCLTRPMERD